MTESEYESHTHTRLRARLKTPLLGIDVRRSVAWALGGATCYGGAPGKFLLCAAWKSAGLANFPGNFRKPESAGLANFQKNFRKFWSGATKELMFIREILVDMGHPPEGPSISVTDSKSGLDTVVNAGATKHTAHFERWLHYARSLQLKQRIKGVLVTTELMRADDKTKVVDKKKFEMCRRETMNLPAHTKDTA